MKYENAWPVCDILAQFLWNSSQAEKRIVAITQVNQSLLLYALFLIVDIHSV